VSPGLLPQQRVKNWKAHTYRQTVLEQQSINNVKLQVRRCGGGPGTTDWTERQPHCYHGMACMHACMSQTLSSSTAARSCCALLPCAVPDATPAMHMSTGQSRTVAKAIENSADSFVAFEGPAHLSTQHHKQRCGTLHTDLKESPQKNLVQHHVLAEAHSPSASSAVWNRSMRGASKHVIWMHAVRQAPPLSKSLPPHHVR
jgi:hypothetical protein